MMVKVMKINKIFLIIIILLGISVRGQEVTFDVERTPFKDIPKSQLKRDEFGNMYYYDTKLQAKIYEINGEKVIVLDEMALMPKPRFNNQLDRNYYFFLNKKLNRVYPLFLTALNQYREIQSQLQTLPSGKKRTYLQERQRALAEQYEAQLRQLTTTEGQVFAKLMNRATGRTVYDIIRELKGGWSAFWWNVKGNMADIELKKEYDPYRNRDDEFVETLLKSNWNLGYLPTYEGYETFKVKK